MKIINCIELHGLVGAELIYFARAYYYDVRGELCKTNNSFRSLSKLKIIKNLGQWTEELLYKKNYE